MSDSGTTPGTVALAAVPEVELVVEVVPVGPAGPGLAAASATIDWGKLPDEARETLAHARAESTRRAYAQDWKGFVTWCVAEGRIPMPADPHDVASYLAHLGALGRSVSKIQRSAAAVAYVHRIAGGGQPAYNARHPVLLEMMEALRRKLGVAPKNQKRPLVEELLVAVCAPLGERLIDVRDRALLLLNYLCPWRGSNIVALEVRDLTFTAEGLDVTIRRSKTDQVGEGYLVAVPLRPDPKLCAVRAVQTWLHAARITEGIVFRSVNRHGRVGGALSVQEVRRIVRRRLEAVGATPPGSKDFGSHSLRAGFCTSAAERGESAEGIMRQTGHTSETVFRYIRHANRFKHNAANSLLGESGKRGRG